jgi:hypothetical protein
MYNISLNSSYSEKCFRQTLQRKSKTHFMFSNFFSPENLAAYDNVEKHGRNREATADNKAHALCFARLSFW